MDFKLLRVRFRKRYRRGQKQVEAFSAQTEQTIEQQFFSRFSKLRPVRRFVIGWVLLLVLLSGGVVAQTVLLSGYFQSYKPIPGGIYTEGVIGRFTTANPLFATNDLDVTVSRLIFNGLLTYNSQANLVNDLSSGYSVDAKGTTYTVHLKPNLTWQDGKPLTAKDVAFTYQTIQNPDVQSPLLSSWQGITIAAPNPTTVTFKLPGVLASFPYNLTTGIVPQHLLASVPPTDLRSADFNTVHPVGSGSFAWQTIQVSGSDANDQQEQIALLPFKGYQGGKPKLQEFIVRSYTNPDRLANDLKSSQLTAAEGLSTSTVHLTNTKAIIQHSFLLNAANMVFFKTSSGQLADKTVRQALVSSANVPAIIASLSYMTRAVREPLLQGQLAYDPSTTQSGFDPKHADALLDQDGWVVGQNGIRTKDGKPLKFTLTASDSKEYRAICKLLQQQWRTSGVDVQLQFQDSTNFQSTLSSRQYDAVLYGISIGADPDVFVYWDSSQADVRSTNRLNLSEYKNPIADNSLEAGRTRLSPELRVIKYKPFLQAWQQDAPAVGLYQPRVLYLTNGAVAGLTDHPVNSASDRFNNVQNWEIRQAKVTNQ
jgi:peptide/nickel transport system substrate-binding protein